MKRMYSRALVLMFSGFAALSYAQETRRLTLDEAVNLGIENSKSLKIDATKIDEATANYLSAKNNRLPDFKISGSALALANATVDLKAVPQASGGNSPKANSAFFGNASFSLPLFAGGRIRYGIQSAEYLIEASKLSVENNKAAVANNVAQAYNNLFKASQAISVLKENLKASQERDRNFLNLENNGVIARNDRLKASLQTSNIELQLLEAENNYNIAGINMDLLLGLPENTRIEVDPGYLSNISPERPVSDYLQDAFQNRKDIQALGYQKKAAELGAKAAKAENLPTIALSAGYVAADIPKIVSIYNAANIGLGVQYNLANIWKKNTSVMNADTQIRKLDATEALIDDQVKLEVNRDYQNWLLAQRKIEVYRNAVEQANENYRITKNKYENGLETITNLLEADAAQISANVSVLNAQADAALAYLKLLQTTGQNLK